MYWGSDVLHCDFGVGQISTRVFFVCLFSLYITFPIFFIYFAALSGFPEKVRREKMAENWSLENAGSVIFVFGIHWRLFGCFNILTCVLLCNLGLIPFPLSFPFCQIWVYPVWLLGKVKKINGNFIIVSKVRKMFTYHLWSKFFNGISPALS